MTRRIHRVQEVVLPILRERFPDVTVTSWIPDIDYRQFPLINVRRLAGEPHRTRPDLLDLPVIELTVLHSEGLVEAENLYMDALDCLYDAVRIQKQTPAGYIHSIFETMGMTQFDSLNMDSWRIQGLIQLGVRPPR